MGNNKSEADVNPEVLKWARKSIDYSKNEIAEKCNLSEEDIYKWEQGEKKPTIQQLKKYAKVVERPMAVFFLPSPPKEEPIPKDFRTLPREEKISLSTETILGIREARQKQKTFKDLLEDETINRLIGSVSLEENPEKVAEEIRNKMDISFEEQKSWNKDYKAYDKWRTYLENQDILIFRYNFPVEEIRGFSFSDKKAPVIVTNKKDYRKAEIFTLFHELGHLLTDESGICIPERWNVSSHSNGIAKQEIFCNQFAGAFLVPKKVLIEHEEIAGKDKVDIYSSNKISKISNSFLVSKEVVIRRLVTHGYISHKEYSEWKENLSPPPEKKGWGKPGRDIPKERINKFGKNFTSMILNSYKNNKIPYVDISDNLDIKTKYISELEERVRD